MIKSALFLIFFVTYSASALAADKICQNLDKDPLYDQILKEIKSCRAHDIHLTFDDGPSVIATAKILDGLKKRDTKATFFISTTNIENGSELQNLVKREIAEGNTVGDHGYDHNAYDLRIVKGVVEEKGYSPADAAGQINKSIDLLNNATNGMFGKQPIKMFRFPYGRGAIPSPDELNYMEQNHQMTFESDKFSERLKEYRKQSRAVGTISEKGFAHLGWNHDSEDTKYGVKVDTEVNVKDFVALNIKRFCDSKESTQVALFHDIKAINAKAIPLIIDIGRCLGLQFISAKEMLKATDKLTMNGVLIPKDFQTNGAVRKPNDVLDTIMVKLSGKSCQLITPPSHKSCSSNNGRTYRHCEGEESICFNGEWESRATIILEGKCDLVK
jgi:peptidoglycan/xylan/chitin deacetylase (PgdA/CDA1 family)